MQQPKQQRTYADLYSQQRSASPVAAAGSAGSNSSGRPLNPESVGAITAAASEQGRAVEGNNNNRQPSTFHAPKVASSAADVKAAGKPSSSRIPTYPGQSASRQHAAAAARPGRGGSPEPTSTRIPAAAAAAACAGANGVSHAAAATTRNDDDADGTTAAKASSTPEPSHHDQVCMSGLVLLVEGLRQLPLCTQSSIRCVVSMLLPVSHLDLASARSVSAVNNIEPSLVQQLAQPEKHRLSDTLRLFCTAACGRLSSILPHLPCSGMCFSYMHVSPVPACLRVPACMCIWLCHVLC